MIDMDFVLTKKDYDWFGDRMTESHTGRVLIPTYLYNKFRKVYDDQGLINADIKVWLIDNVYNSGHRHLYYCGE